MKTVARVESEARLDPYREDWRELDENERVELWRERVLVVDCAVSPEIAEMGAQARDLVRGGYLVDVRRIEAMVAAGCPADLAVSLYV